MVLCCTSQSLVRLEAVQYDHATPEHGDDTKPTLAIVHSAELELYEGRNVRLLMMYLPQFRGKPRRLRRSSRILCSHFQLCRAD